MRRNSHILGRIRWAALAVAMTFAGTLFIVTSGAQAVVVNDHGIVAGVSLVPTARGLESTVLTPAGVSIVTSTGTCADPAASTEPDILTAGSWPLSAPAQPLCWHSGPVMHANETFTLEWEGQAPNTYWSTTKGYVQNFLGDVASASGQLVNPYSDTTQYWDGASAQSRAAYSSVFGGGCDDNGTAKCQFGSTTGSGPGNSLPSSSSCPVTGDNTFGGSFAGGPTTTANNLCVTDGDIQGEVKSLIANDGLIAHTQPGHTPLVTVLTPPGVVVCLDAAGHLCSANGTIAPPPPLPSAAPTGGTVAAGAYQVVVTYQFGSAESVPSAPATVTTTGATSTITIPSPPSEGGASGWYAYITAPNGATYYRQGGANAMGASLTLSAPPDTSGAAPPGNASFCSYHSQLVDPQSGQPVSYVVQPWTAFSICDEPDIGTVAPYTPPSVVEKSAGERLLSPLSQSSIAAIVNPQFNGWVGNNGLEIDDQNACQPEGHGLDSFSFGTSGQAPYFLQRESNNASVVDSDPWTYNGCLPEAVLQPSFALPSAVNLGDTIDLDGSATASALDIPNANYSWKFGDGTNGTGPSVEHTFGSAGNFTVTLTATDRGGNQASLAQTVSVLGANGLPGPAVNPPTTTPNVGSNGALQVRIQLLPQGLRQVLRSGIRVQVSANEAANGMAWVSITRTAAKRAHIKAGRGRLVVIGRGTLSQVTKGTLVLHLYLSHATAAKLSHLKHLEMTVRLSLVGPGGDHLAVDAAGRY